jgi:ABC-type phosphate transport system substrate-binding protein
VKPLYEAWSNAYRATRDDVTVVYDVEAAEQALDNILSGQNDFINLNAAVDSSDPDSIEQYGSMFQVPIAAQGLAFTYNLPTLNASTDPLLVLDLKALADVRRPLLALPRPPTAIIVFLIYFLFLLFSDWCALFSFYASTLKRT